MHESRPRASRRSVLEALGSLSAAALFGCGSSTIDGAGASGGGAGASGAGAGASGAGGGAGASGGGASSGRAGNDESSAGEAGGGMAGNASQASEGGAASSGDGAWATSGTSILSGKDYGNPFAAGAGPTCNVYKAATAGPCHATSSLLTRKDVSEGYPGLPMRLELLVVDASCRPIPTATVEIWMCDTVGIYSGDIDGDNDAFCTGGSAAAAAALWGRGIQTAGSDGRITFDANFPGWYASRATHIHFKVTVGGTAYITSQLFFDDDFKSAIYDTQPNYKATTGAGYVSNSNDQVIKESNLALGEVAVSTQQQSDGALLAWKTITVSS